MTLFSCPLGMVSTVRTPFSRTAFMRSIPAFGGRFMLRRNFSALRSTWCHLSPLISLSLVICLLIYFHDLLFFHFYLYLILLHSQEIGYKDMGILSFLLVHTGSNKELDCGERHCGLVAVTLGLMVFGLCSPSTKKKLVMAMLSKLYTRYDHRCMEWSYMLTKDSR